MALRCMIVDDNPSVLVSARALLERERLAVVGVASTRAEALALAGAHAPDVALVDIDLGPESGFDVARGLTDVDGGRGPRVILISTHDQRDFVDLIEASPAVGFLSKSELSAGAIRALLSEPRGT